jgi:hypothetical protein
MATYPAAARLPFRTVNGTVVGDLQLLRPDRSALEAMIELTSVEARELGEERVQLVEQRRYPYKVLAPGWSLADASGDIATRTSAPAEAHEYGVVKVGSNAGLLILVLVNAEGINAQACVEVRSSNLGYREEYRRMIEDIVSRSASLIYRIRSAGHIRLIPGPPGSARAAAEVVGFLESLLKSKRFARAVEGIKMNPHRRLVEEPLRREIRRPARLGRTAVIGLRAGGRRVPLPELHPLYRRMRALGVEYPTVPQEIQSKIKNETVDTAENRFVKHVFGVFRRELGLLATRLATDRTASGRRAAERVRTLEQAIEDVLSGPAFKKVGQLSYLPLNSTVLQTDERYREILSTWMRFQAASALTWDGGDHVYAAGRRQLDVLYEYWCFFELLKLATPLCSLDEIGLRTLIEATGDRLGLKLKQGEAWGIEGRMQVIGGQLGVRFYYNRLFQQKDDAQLGGSWTRALRPDFTFAFWPIVDHTYEEATRMGKVRYIHFDAKYRAVDIPDLFGSEEATAGESLREREQYVAADLLKMHAYRDAVRGTLAAFVLFPGRAIRKFTSDRSEPYPSVGAIGLRPLDTGLSGLRQIGTIVNDAATYCGRAFFR